TVSFGTFNFGRLDLDIDPANGSFSVGANVSVGFATLYGNVGISSYTPFFDLATTVGFPGCPYPFVPSGTVSVSAGNGTAIGFSGCVNVMGDVLEVGFNIGIGGCFTLSSVLPAPASDINCETGGWDVLGVVEWVCETATALLNVFLDFEICMP
ncbi:MAG: hypothetical protein ACI9MR_003380, partial [Myxococcota bacterium]